MLEEHDYRYFFPNIYAHENFSHNVILSYPRSGNTWLRYCFESTSLCPTFGYFTANFKDYFLGQKWHQPGNHEGMWLDAPILMQLCNFDATFFEEYFGIPITRFITSKPTLKRHGTDSFVFANKNNRLILLKRNPYDAIMRHVSTRKGDPDLSTVQASIELFLGNVKLYDEWDAQKRSLIDYKNLLKPSDELIGLLMTMGSCPKRIDTLCAEFEKHREFSFRLYDERDSADGGVGSVTYNNTTFENICDKETLLSMFLAADDKITKKYIVPWMEQ